MTGTCHSQRQRGGQEMVTIRRAKGSVVVLDVSLYGERVLQPTCQWGSFICWCHDWRIVVTFFSRLYFQLASYNLHFSRKNGMCAVSIRNSTNMLQAFLSLIWRIWTSGSTWTDGELSRSTQLLLLNETFSMLSTLLVECTTNKEGLSSGGLMQRVRVSRSGKIVSWNNIQVCKVCLPFRTLTVWGRVYGGWWKRWCDSR